MTWVRFALFGPGSCGAGEPIFDQMHLDWTSARADRSKVCAIVGSFGSFECNGQEGEGKKQLLGRVSLRRNAFLMVPSSHLPSRIYRYICYRPGLHRHLYNNQFPRRNEDICLIVGRHCLPSCCDPQLCDLGRVLCVTRNQQGTTTPLFTGRGRRERRQDQ